MPNTCSAPLCRTGYPGEAKDPTTVFHRVPLKNKELMKKWITAIPRANYKPTIHSRLCSNHFVIEDYADAIPSVFTGIPKSCLKRIPKPRSNNASSSARLNKQRKKSMEDYQKFLDSDRVDSIRELLEKFDRRNIPSGIDEISRNNEMMFLSLIGKIKKLDFHLKFRKI
ncbi:unnamed protein product [Lepeophtheirus salmonis]|uniref:(salmon louse) hypothetical protein n=1 Tax=Lepeophtheirus salmonis TaxID=72036 RepID=A0A7R8H1S7_LEPSM|nr:unnamed protein product [Lepeophtheirus salmonis]CAF2799145.1 unnamed protein product [Lepeophtheirus salmonis]